MQYFDKDFISFFKELKENNHKEWFDENRKRYEKIVKEPFKVFVSDMIRFVSSQDPEVRVEPKDCIFRINRDIRFAKDKTPYKTGVSCAINPGGKKNMNSIGIYIELNAYEVRLYSGVFGPGKEDLKNIRNHIAQNLSEFKALINESEFLTNFEGIKGDKNKVIPKEFKEVAEQEELIKNKQFYFFKQYPSSIITSETFQAQLIEDYHIITPLISFFREAVL